MTKILLNVLIFVGSQQFILGTENNKEPETKLGFCLSCYNDNGCTHEIYDTYEEEDQNNCPKNYPEKCVKQVYSVCSKGHTMCGQCIYDRITDGLKNKGGTINCFYCGIDPNQKFGKKKFQPCYEPINKEIIEYILKNFATSEKETKILEKYNRLVKELEYKRVLLHPENKACKYENCKGFFNVTENFFCNQNESHIHCKLCFEKEHEGKCKDPLLEYNSSIDINRNVQKQIKNKELGDSMIEGCKPCPNCHKIITKVGGCNHITCGCDYGANNWKDNGCGYQWCWRCGVGYNDMHYHDENGCCYKKMFPSLWDESYDDGDYFGIINGKFEEQFEKLAREGVIDVEVDVKVYGQYDNIKKVDWDAINKGKKEWEKKNPNEKYYEEEEWKEENPNEKYYKEEDNTKNKGIYDYCNDCCEKCLMEC